MVAYSTKYNPETPKVLVIEDNPLHREYVKGVLGLLSYTVTEAINGAEGLKKSIDQDFDLVVTDLMMPEMDGITFIEEIRKVKPETKIIAMTAGGRNEKRECYASLAEKSDINGFLKKPFKGIEMHKMVKEILLS